jgi:hypothetical protein
MLRPLEDEIPAQMAENTTMVGIAPTGGSLKWSRMALLFSSAVERLAVRMTALADRQVSNQIDTRQLSLPTSCGLAGRCVSRADHLERQLRRAVRVQQAVGLLEGVGELGVAEAAEHEGGR